MEARTLSCRRPGQLSSWRAPPLAPVIPPGAQPPPASTLSPCAAATPDPFPARLPPPAALTAGSTVRHWISGRSRCRTHAHGARRQRPWLAPALKAATDDGPQGNAGVDATIDTAAGGVSKRGTAEGPAAGNPVRVQRVRAGLQQQRTTGPATEAQPPPSAARESVGSGAGGSPRGTRASGGLLSRLVRGRTPQHRGGSGAAADSLGLTDPGVTSGLTNLGVTRSAPPRPTAESLSRQEQLQVDSDPVQATRQDATGGNADDGSVRQQRVYDSSVVQMLGLEDSDDEDDEFSAGEEDNARAGPGQAAAAPAGEVAAVGLGSVDRPQARREGGAASGGQGREEVAAASVRDGGAVGSSTADDVLAIRLSRVISFVESQLLGDPAAAAAAAAVSVVHPDAPLPPPATLTAATQPPELFAEPPMTGRVLARAAAAEHIPQEVPSPPTAADWALLGGGAGPSPPRSPSTRTTTTTGSTANSATTTTSTDADDANTLFRRRQRDLAPYMSYLRDVVLQSGPAPSGRPGDAAEASGANVEGGRGGGGGGDDGRSWVGGLQRAAGATRTGGRVGRAGGGGAVGPGSVSDGEQLPETVRTAIMEEAASAMDWLQLSILLEAVGAAGRGDPGVLGAVFKQAAGLIVANGPGPDGADSAATGRPPVPYGGGSPAEAAAWSAFCEQLAAAGRAALSAAAAARKDVASRGRSGRGGRGGGGGGVSGGGACSGREIAQIAYGMGTLQLSCPDLYDAVLQSSGEQLAALAAAGRGAVNVATAAALTGRQSSLMAARNFSAVATMTAAAAATTSGISASVRRHDPNRRRQYDRRSPLPAPWAAADLASLAWGVALAWSGGDGTVAAGSIVHHHTTEGAVRQLPRPSVAWFAALADVTRNMFSTATPTQLWGLLWSYARLSYIPSEDWMRSYITRVETCMSEFEPEGLVRVVWSLAALDYPVDRLWMRAVVGQIHHRVRQLSAPQLLTLMAGLCRLGYAPRPEVGAGLHAAIIRLMPLMRPDQLGALGAAAAGFERWRPGPAFLRALAAAALPHLPRLSPTAAARLLWCWARSEPPSPQRSVPATATPSSSATTPQSQSSSSTAPTGTVPGAGGMGAESTLLPVLLHGLLQRVYLGLNQLYGTASGTMAGPSGCGTDGSPSAPCLDGTALSMALWSTAVLRRPPGPMWLAAWWAAATNPWVTATFDATSIAQSLWAAAQLMAMDRPVRQSCTTQSPDLSERDGLLSSAASAEAEAAVAALLGRLSGLMAGASTAALSTTIAALADLQYRPSDAWMTLFAAEVRRRLAAESTANEDHGLIAYGMAVLGWPLEEPWIKELAAGGYRRLSGMSGEAVGLLLWGLSMYGWSTDSNRFWGAVFRETGAKWDSCSARSVVLLYCAVADMLPPGVEPPFQWQRQLAKALRLRLPRPPTGALIPAALRAAAGGCLGLSPLRLREPAAAAAMATAAGSGLYSSGSGRSERSRRRPYSALDESLRASEAAEDGLYGSGGLFEMGDEEEGEIWGPDHPEWGEEAGWGADWELAGWGNSEGEEEGLEGQWGGDPDVWGLGEEAEAEGQEGPYGRGYDRETAAASSAPIMMDPPLKSSYVLDSDLDVQDLQLLDPYGISSSRSARPAGLRGSSATDSKRAIAARARASASDKRYDDDVAFQLPLPMEVTDPRDHPALAAATADRRMWWAHDVADELRWLWGLPGAVRELPPWVRQPSLGRLRSMMR